MSWSIAFSCWLAASSAVAVMAGEAEGILAWRVEGMVMAMVASLYVQRYIGEYAMCRDEGVN